MTVFRRRPIPVPAHWVAQEPPASRVLTAPVISRAWRSLFDGATLNGWTVEDGKDQWTVDDGAIVCRGTGSGYLRSNEQFGDFALAIEFNIEKGTNSGVFVRWSNIKDPVNTGIEVQILDSAGKQRPDKHDSGALYDLVAPSVNTMRPAGEWNRMVIVCQGPYITSRLNGVRVAEMDLSQYTRPGRNPNGSRNKFRYAMGTLPPHGYIGLQNHGGPLRFRSISLLPL
jgi:hypothetical protein